MKMNQRFSADDRLKREAFKSEQSSTVGHCFSTVVVNPPSPPPSTNTFIIEGIIWACQQVTYVTRNLHTQHLHFERQYSLFQTHLNQLIHTSLAKVAQQHME